MKRNSILIMHPEKKMPKGHESFLQNSQSLSRRLPDHLRLESPGIEN